MPQRTRSREELKKAAKKVSSVASCAVSRDDSTPYYQNKPLPKLPTTAENVACTPEQGSGDQVERTDRSDPERMNADTLEEVLRALSDILGHIPYAVSGAAAMAIYGIARRAPKHVSIICAEYSKDNIRFWAMTKGLDVRADSIWLRTSDGRQRRVRIKFTDENRFNNLSRIPVGDTGSCVLTLPELMEFAAASWFNAGPYPEDQPHQEACRDVLECALRITRRHRQSWGLIGRLGAKQVLDPLKAAFVMRLSRHPRCPQMVAGRALVPTISRACKVQTTSVWEQRSIDSSQMSMSIGSPAPSGVRADSILNFPISRDYDPFAEDEFLIYPDIAGDLDSKQDPISGLEERMRNPIVHFAV